MSTRPIRIAFQGEVGAFSELAVRHFASEYEFEAVPEASFENVFQSLERAAVEEAVVPIENSLFGSVHTNYDLLREHEVHIVAELKLRIHHHLLALPGSSLDEIETVVSHPQALGQCRNFLARSLPHAHLTPAYDTAGSAKEIAEGRIGNRAAIASEAAAAEYGLEILAHNVESNAQNFTRFLKLRRGSVQEAKENIPSTHGRTSIVFAMRDNVAGALFKSLAVFALRELDLVKIESRPLVGSPFEYLFYLDFHGSLKEERVSRALDHLREIAGYLKILGCYPDGPMIG